MTIHIVSDNALLLLGVREKIREETVLSKSLALKTHSPHFSEEDILSDDVVLICIYSKIIRMNTLERITKLTCNIAIMVQSNFQHKMTSSYPIRVPRKISFHEIVMLGKRMKRQPPPVRVCNHTYQIFRELYQGESVHSVVAKKQLNLTTIYNLKKRVFKRFGLKNINDKGVIHCMEYLEINRLARESLGQMPGYELRRA
ncbi:hypothetical protein ACMYSK_10160 [Klebsiella sp. I138]|uniref:hypothetical protein n=1 Tax=Klebsiella sp. I138 TaxID=2755385 RepID=UPI003DA99C9F